MRSVVRNLILVIAALLIAIWAIIPPEKKLRLGKDLRGGVSLVYSVVVRPGDPSDTVARVIDVLKERVDPTGQSDITMVQQGRDRIEVTMPLPSERVKRLKEAFETQLAALDASALDGAQFERIMRMAPAEREAEIARMGEGNPARAAALREAASAADAATAAREQFNQAQQALRAAREAGADAARIAELSAAVDRSVQETAELELAYDTAREKVLAATLTGTEVRRALAQPDQTRTLFDEVTKEQVVLESPRKQALERLFTQYPDRRETLEKIIAAYDTFAAERTNLDDPADLKRMLASAGVLDFRIAVDPGYPQEAALRQELQEKGPRNVSATDVRWYALDSLEGWYRNVQTLKALQDDPAGYFRSAYGLIVEKFENDYYALLWDTRGNRLTHAEGDWSVAAAYGTRDDRGFPAIGFTMDPVGAGLLGDLTGRHVGNKMAVLLDDRVYTAPNLQSRISKSGQITGQFTQDEINYITRVLGAGALQAKLVPQPISESAIGPNLGLDNLRSGLRAGVIAFVIIAGFMVVYYFSSGFIAVVSLACNGLLLLGMMSLNKAAFTMPGIAGVILTFGMAVDANVLIFERMREEIKKGNDLRTSVRLGYSKALSSIVDGNVTNLIVCVVLYSVGTAEIKGFAITMSIGVLTTLFSALVISRVIYSLLVDHGPWRKASMLPLAVPAIDRFFERSVDWLRLRYAFWAISGFFVALGLFFVAYQGKNMLDNEFRGGTQITLQLTELQTRQNVMDRVKLAADSLGATEMSKELRNANVLPINPEDDGVTSDQFTIKTLAQDQGALMTALLPEFDDITEADPPLVFEGAGAENLREAPVHRIIDGNLGRDIDRPAFQDNIRDFIGGAAIVLEEMRPMQSLAELQTRLDRMRADPEFSETLRYQRSLRVLEGTPEEVRSAVLLVRDPQLSFLDNEQRFDIEVAGREWELVRRALTEPSAPASVQNFSAAIATTFRAQAIVAIVLSFLLIGIYVWVRFGAVNYALGAVVPMLHDILIVVGLIAVAEVLFEWPVTAGLAASIGLLPFKIDLAMIAAFLTIVGYSLNDSVVIMDRIRENRGKLPYASADAINNAVNQTISRTVITSGTTLFSTAVLFFLGGEGVRGFAFSLSVGIIVGTYSSIALTAPMVWVKNTSRFQKNLPPRSGPPSSGGAAAPAPAVAGSPS